ncbi:hypothetical protein CEXT_151171 [Caerostris extrusa]|uniref:Uncharacterized protein n=1 Tax=Caerostris extrusa TaxID=172846 RepID=A0AAV4XX64_CAEEX|nr:hypothetical protein CEXT_151171 [Caerostris extrusa]
MSFLLAFSYLWSPGDKTVMMTLSWLRYTCSNHGGYQGFGDKTVMMTLSWLRYTCSNHGGYPGFGEIEMQVKRRKWP